MIAAAVTIFAAQAVMVFLLGLQSPSVQGRHYALAASISTMLGITGYQVTAIIAQASHEPMGSVVWWAYIIAGPIGITASIWAHPRLKRMISRTDKV